MVPLWYQLVMMLKRFIEVGRTVGLQIGRKFNFCDKFMEWIRKLIGMDGSSITQTLIIYVFLEFNNNIIP